ncbi:MAG: VWA domain-containing protein, partial [Kofleriaceae bacterium]
STKRELAAELAAVVAFSAIKNNDRVGLYIITDRVEKYVPPKKGRKHVLRVIGEILAFEPESRGTDLAKGLDFFSKVAKRRSVVFFVSDFLSEGWERAMRIASQRHEIVPVLVGDPMEAQLPNVGLLVLEDLETGAVIEVDTSRRARRDFEEQAIASAARRDQALRRLALDVVPVSTDQPYVDALIAFFKARAKRMAHG